MHRIGRIRELEIEICQPTHPGPRRSVTLLETCRQRDMQHDLVRGYATRALFLDFEVTFTCYHAKNEAKNKCFVPASTCRRSIHAK